VANSIKEGNKDMSTKMSELGDIGWVELNALLYILALE